MPDGRKTRFGFNTHNMNIIKTPDWKGTGQGFVVYKDNSSRMLYFFKIACIFSVGVITFTKELS